MVSYTIVASLLLAILLSIGIEARAAGPENRGKKTAFARINPSAKH